jgi:putative transposase
MESFFGLLKRECVYRRPIYRTPQEARADLFGYIERFYNRQRRHGTAGRMSPMDFEQMFFNSTVH